MSTSTPLLPRMANPALALDGALPALLGVSKVAGRAGLGFSPELLNLRASQINGCAVCVDMHAKALREAGEPEARVFAVCAWRETPYFTEPERAALALTEALTRIADQGEPVPDAVYDAVAEHFDEQQVASIVLTIGVINLWNRLNVATRQVVDAGGVG
jgi:AhpD family alkylhydroperoxidase